MPAIRTSKVDNGTTTPGYLAVPEGDGPFPGVIVVQEWWGLEDHIKDVAERFAREGFAAFAPDLYHGKVTAEPDEAMKMMMSLDMLRATEELVAATDWLASQPYIQGRGIGAIGFCMGGGLALSLACASPHIKAVAPFYGATPDPPDKVASINGPVFAVYAEHDDFFGPPVREALREALTKHGKQFTIETYPGTSHAFFNDTRPEVHNPEASKDAWSRVIELFKANL
jgi:carboxymethylenebutenolidase